MDFSFSRLDYFQVGPTLPNTTKLLPCSSSNDTQKVVVGDCNGVVQLFSLQKSNLQMIFKSLPSKSISAVKLGGSLHSAKDKVFVASGNRVQAYTRRGKQFLNMETNLADDIRSIHVSGSDLLVCTDFVYNRYHDCRETNYYLSSDNITDVTCLSAEKLNALVPVLACRDLSLRVLKESGVRYSVGTLGVAVCTELVRGDGGVDGQWLLYGSSTGVIACVHLGMNESSAGWSLTSNDGGACVNCVHHCDVTGDGVQDLVAGRDDGSVLLYSYDLHDDPYTSPPTLRSSHVTSSGVSSVQAGQVSSVEQREILVTTCSGQIFGLVMSESHMFPDDLQQDSSDPAERSDRLMLSQNASEIFQKLRDEVSALQQSVDKNRAKYEETCSVDRRLNTPLTASHLAVTDKMVLCSADSSYLLTIESQCSLDMIMLQSDVVVDLVDVAGNSAVLSITPCDPASGNSLLATYRCQTGTSRIQVRLRTIEGQYGTLRAYIMPKIEPKWCQMRHYCVRPLSLHMRTHHFDTNRSHSVVVVSGRFSYSDAHAWLAFCLPDVSARCPLESSSTITFQSAFVSTQLQVTYTSGRIEFKSDNVSTLSILKDVITKEATQRNIHVSISSDLNKNSMLHTLQLLHPKLHQLRTLSAQVALLEPLRELTEHEQDDTGSFLCEQHRAILTNAPQLCQQAAHHSVTLQRLYEFWRLYGGGMRRFRSSESVNATSNGVYGRLLTDGPSNGVYGRLNSTFSQQLWRFGMYRYHGLNTARSQASVAMTTRNKHN